MSAPLSAVQMLTSTSLQLTQHERHGDETGVVVAVNRQLFKIPLLVIMQEKSEGENDAQG